MKAFLALFRDLLSVLPPNARRFIIGYSIALALLAILDAISLGLLAVVITPLVAGTAISLPLIGTIEGVGLFALIGVVCVLVLAKGFLSVLLLWFATRRFALFELTMGSRLFDAYIASP